VFCVFNYQIQQNEKKQTNLNRFYLENRFAMKKPHKNHNFVKKKKLNTVALDVYLLFFLVLRLEI